jgi:alpha-beta hydrolase superfamily lysophospholipase
MQVELVNTETSDGIRLDGILRRPSNEPDSTLGVDAVILHHGIMGNFYAPSYFDVVSQQWLALGCAVLRVNNRGHDVIYITPKGRFGAAFDAIDDCRVDWRAWIDFAEEQGYKRVALWGHSLGAVKTIYYLATESDNRVPWAVATSPPLLSHSNFLAKDGSGRFSSFYREAMNLVENGDKDRLLVVDTPTNRIFAAKTYLENYGEQERYNILHHLPHISVPLLITIGTLEGLSPESADWFPFGGLAAKVRTLAEELPNVTFEPIEGANHAYVGKAETLWSTTSQWFQMLSSRQPV